MNKFIAIIASLMLLVNCSHQHNNKDKIIKVGTISGPETTLMEVACDVAAARFGLKVTIVEFTDYNMPNIALDEGSLDANAFQHEPFLKAAIKAHNFKLTAIGKTFIYPMGVYSKKIKSLKDLPNKGIVAIPNDPSNEARALLLLEKAGLIQLADDNNLFATTADITKNPKQLEIKELAAAQLARVLDDVDIAVINTTFAMPAGLYPKRDALFIESKLSPYANVIVVNECDKDKKELRQLVKAFQSPEVLAKAKELFSNQAIPAWNTL